MSEDPLIATIRPGWSSRVRLRPMSEESLRAFAGPAPLRQPQIRGCRSGVTAERIAEHVAAPQAAIGDPKKSLSLRAPVKKGERRHRSDPSAQARKPSGRPRSARPKVCAILDQCWRGPYNRALFMAAENRIHGGGKSKRACLSPVGRRWAVKFLASFRVLFPGPFRKC